MMAARFLGDRAFLPVTLCIGFILAAAASVVAAAPLPPPDSSAGRVGAHRLIDSVTKPGATCRYGSIEEFGYYNGLARIHVRAPVAFARKHLRSQRIGARVKVQAWDGIDWQLYRQSSWQHRSAKPKVAASFTARDVAVDQWPHHSEHIAYRTRVDLRWYGADRHKVVGRASLYVREYLGKEEGNSDFASHGACSSTTG